MWTRVCPLMLTKNVSTVLRKVPACIRRYASAPPVDVTKRIHYRPKNRVYGARKSHLHAQYARLLENNDVLLLVRYDNVNVNTLSKMRREVAALASKSSPKIILSPSPSSFASSSSAAITFIRPGVFAASLRTQFDEATVQRTAKTFRGSYALISIRELNPPHLAQIIRLIDRVVPPVKDEPPPPARKGPANPDDLEEAPPRQKAAPSIKLVAGVVEDRFFLVDDLVAISKLPTLQTLHAQIVGLLSAPAAKLAQILGAAAGGSLLRTLQGFEKGLEEVAKGPEKSEGP
jgi:ribosomal protein L10